MERPSDRDLVLEIAQAGIARVAPGPMIDQLVHTTDSHAVFGAGSEATRVAWSEVDRVLVLGAGKASAAMARALEGVLGDRISGGCVVTKYDHGVPLERIELIEAGHPVPDEQSLAAAQRIAARADEADERTLVVLLISGGGSSLLAAPLSPSRSARETRTGETSLASLTLDDLAATTRLLLGAGAPIGEVNCVRRHL